MLKLLKKYYLIFVAVILAVVLLVLKLNLPENSSKTTSSISAGWTTHTNTKYKFSFSYPKNLELQGLEGKNEDNFSDTDPAYLLQLKKADSNGSHKKVLSIFRSTNDGTGSGLSLSDWSDNSATSYCNADGPCAHATCPSINKKNVITTKNGLKGFETYSNFEFTSCAGAADSVKTAIEENQTCTCSRETRVVGPAYMLDTLGQSNYTLHDIYIRPEVLENDSLLISQSDYQQIIDSIKFYQ